MCTLWSSIIYQRPNVQKKVSLFPLAATNCQQPFLKVPRACFYNSAQFCSSTIHQLYRSPLFSFVLGKRPIRDGSPLLCLNLNIYLSNLASEWYRMLYCAGETKTSAIDLNEKHYLLLFHVWNKLHISPMATVLWSG